MKINNKDYFKGRKCYIWDKFRVDEKSYDDTSHNLKLKNCSVLKSEV